MPADWRRALSSKSRPLASCCRYSCRAQIILSVWSGLHLFRTQPLCFHQSESSAECRRSERTGQREAEGSNRRAVSPKLGLSPKKKTFPPGIINKIYLKKEKGKKTSIHIHYIGNCIGNPIGNRNIVKMSNIQIFLRASLGLGLRTETNDDILSCPRHVTTPGRGISWEV